MAKVTKVHKAQKDYPQYGIKKGDSYYWWKFRFGGKHFSKTYPKRSQLTQSEFLSTVYDIEDELQSISSGDFSEAGEIKDFVAGIIDRLESLRDEQEGKRDNMPEQLQESATGELLQGRYENLDEMIDELNNIDLDDFDEDDGDADFEQWASDKCDEINAVGYNGE